MVLISKGLLCSEAFGSTFKEIPHCRLVSQRSAFIRVSALQASYGLDETILREGPSCVFVGPVETARKDRLEALYQQARDSYYSGQPLIVDDMFDKVEVRLRWYGSKLVLKYPRCSLKRLSVYADAEVDNSQVMALACIWMIFLAAGLVTAVGPPACALNKACKDAVHFHFVHRNIMLHSADVGVPLSTSILMAVGLAIGVPMATAALGALQGLWRGDLVALKGSCPSCGEEVYAFVRADNSPHPRHKTECHVCEHPLVFQAKVEQSASPRGRPWAYGRIYLVKRLTDFAPP